jgi:hypothetical protein
LSKPDTISRPAAQSLPKREVILTPGNHDVNLARINPTLETGLQHELLDQEVLNALQSALCVASSAATSPTGRSE